MVLFNYSTKELTAKVVYYGPGLCGKTTNLQWIHEKLPIKNKGKMLSLATETDRTLFFDFLPIELGTIRGMKTRIQLYTVPGQVFYNATRRMVLKGADCVVFVCDSQEAMLEANIESIENLRENLEVNEIDPDEIPTVMQYNKRDLPNALPIEILNDKLNPRGLLAFEAMAIKGVGVEETLRGVTGLVFKSLAAKYGGAEAAARAAPQKAEVTAPPARPPARAPARPPAPPRAPAPRVPLEAEESDEDLLDSIDLGRDEPAQEAFLGAEEEEISFDAPMPRVDAKATLVKNEKESAEIRRKISQPPPPPEVSLESLEDDIAEEEEIETMGLEETPPPRPQAPRPAAPPPPPQRPAPTRPAPASAPKLGSAVQTIPPHQNVPPLQTIPPSPAKTGKPQSQAVKEVVVPIELHLGEGDLTEVKLQIRLVLNLKVDR